MSNKIFASAHSLRIASGDLFATISKKRLCLGALLADCVGKNAQGAILWNVP